MTATTQGRRAEVVWTTACRDCGMPCGLNEYHPYAACLMFRGCQDSAVVRANLPPSADTLAEIQRRVEDALRLADVLDDVVLGNEMNGYVQGAIERVANELRAILGGDGKEG